VGVLGAARVVPTALLRPARDWPFVRVDAIAARDPLRASAFAARHTIPRVHASYAALVADPGIDAVYVALPNALHAPWTEAALRAGKDVLCEKPLCANAEEARRIAVVAREAGRIVMEAMHWRYHPIAERALALVTHPDFGPVEQVRAAIHAPPLFDRSDIRWDASLAGGALMDVGVYAFHMLRVFGGELAVTSARVALHAATAGSVERAADAEVRFDGGARGLMTCSLRSWRAGDLSLHVRGARGSVTLLNPHAPHLFHALIVMRGRRVHVERRPGPTTYHHQLAAFARAVRERRPPLTDAEDAARTLAAIDASYRLAGLAPRRSRATPTSS